MNFICEEGTCAYEPAYIALYSVQHPHQLSKVNNIDYVYSQSLPVHWMGCLAYDLMEMWNVLDVYLYMTQIIVSSTYNEKFTINPFFLEDHFVYLVI